MTASVLATAALTRLMNGCPRLCFVLVLLCSLPRLEATTEASHGCLVHKLFSGMCGWMGGRLRCSNVHLIGDAACSFALHVSRYINERTGLCFFLYRESFALQCGRVGWVQPSAVTCLAYGAGQPAADCVVVHSRGGRGADASRAVLC